MTLKNKFLIPLVLFFILVGFLALGLNRDPHEIPSPLVNKPAPAFELPTLNDDKLFSPTDYKGKVWLLNVWATWCVSCRQEHPVLIALTQQHHIPVVGLSYKEIQPQETQLNQLPADQKLQLARQRSQLFLNQLGNPYVLSVMDMDGRVGIQYGVYGVPETYVIDQQGVIRYKHVGPVTPELIDKKLLPLLRQLEKT
ncbi:MAG: DsbE family thiol:disulfide interchange protein [Limnohabitans sp.]|nr:DsbE family thiol:disulfide interchange protein [Limnohabitans sp.]